MTEKEEEHMTEKEAVIFLFRRKDKVLIEYRLTEKGKFEEIFIPNGHVEETDRNSENYLENAMLREVGEEFKGKVKPTSYTYADKYHVEEMGMTFHIYIIDSWQGTHPHYSTEEGKRFSKLRWMPIDEALEIMPYPSGIFALEKAKKIKPQ